MGASAGGVKALVEFIRALPHDFPASIFVVQHVAPYSESLLPGIFLFTCRPAAFLPERKAIPVQGVVLSSYLPVG